MDPTIWYKIL